MNAMTAAERQRVHRLRKAVKEFQEWHKIDSAPMSAEEFIDLRTQYDLRDTVYSTFQVEAGFENLVYEYLKDYESEDGRYTLLELETVWKQASREYRLQYE